MNVAASSGSAEHHRVRHPDPPGAGGSPTPCLSARRGRHRRPRVRRLPRRPARQRHLGPGPGRHRARRPGRGRRSLRAATPSPRRRQAVTSTVRLRRLIASHAPGETVSVTWTDASGASQATDVTLTRHRSPDAPVRPATGQLPEGRRGAVTERIAVADQDRPRLPAGRSFERRRPRPFVLGELRVRSGQAVRVRQRVARDQRPPCPRRRPPRGPAVCPGVPRSAVRRPRRRPSAR